MSVTSGVPGYQIRSDAPTDVVEWRSPSTTRSARPSVSAASTTETATGGNGDVPGNVSTWPCATTTRGVVAGSSRVSSPDSGPVSGSAAGRRLRHGAPTISTDSAPTPTVTAVSVRTWTFGGATARHSALAQTLPGSRLSWLPGSR